jgi:hypothetical protein
MVCRVCEIGLAAALFTEYQLAEFRFDAFDQSINGFGVASRF